MSLGKIIYSLDCGHAATAPASFVNGKLFCPWHLDMQMIIGVIEYEWHATCKSCNYGRWAGLDKRTAELFANGHSRRNNTHHLIVEYTVNQDAVKTREKMERFGADN
jgi:hypothetical protein